MLICPACFSMVKELIHHWNKFLAYYMLFHIFSIEKDALLSSVFFHGIWKRAEIAYFFMEKSWNSILNFADTMDHLFYHGKIRWTKERLFRWKRGEIAYNRRGIYFSVKQSISYLDTIWVDQLSLYLSYGIDIYSNV